MAFDFEARLTNIVTALKDNNATGATYDLSAGLTVRVSNDNIIPTRSDKVRPTWRGDRFPAIFVRVPQAKQEFLTLGGMSGVQNAKKQMIVTYSIVGFVGLEGAHKGIDVLDTEMRILAKNIGGIIDRENTASGTALWVMPVSYTFDYEDVGGSLVGSLMVELEGKYLFV
jgi:hypothetical protein